MQWIIIAMTGLHVLAGVFWAGSTFALARNGGAGVEKLAFPQMGAATLTVLAGIGLWAWSRPDLAGTPGLVLSLGALSAVIAAGLQGVALSRVKRLRSAEGPELAGLHNKIWINQRMAAGLLAVTVISMAVWRYA